MAHADIKVVRSKDELVMLLHSAGITQTTHVFVFCALRDVYDLLEDIVRKQSVYSIFCLPTEISLGRRLANSTEFIPVFSVDSEEEGNRIVAKLVSDPVETVSGALNHTAVAINFASGFPT